MTNEPTPGGKPEDETPKEPEEADLDDLDIESLLEDDFEEAAADVSGGIGAEDEDTRVIDDGEIDLVDDTAAEIVSPDEILDLDDIADSGKAPDEAPQPAEADADAAEEISIDDLLADDLEEAAAPAEAEEISVDDLLADDLVESAEETPTPAAEGEEVSIDDLLAEDIVEGGEEAPAAAEGPEDISVDDLLAEDITEGDITEDVVAEETDALPPPEDEGEEAPEEKPARGEKKFGRKKLGRKGTAPSGKKLKGARKEKLSKQGKKPRKEKEVAAPPPVSSRGSITFVCSECYEEFLLPASFSEEVVSCPECLHVGKRPDEDFLATVKMHKSGEAKTLVIATAVAFLLLCVLGSLLVVFSPDWIQKSGVPDEMMTYGLLGGVGIFALALIWCIIKFEGNRWEVYF